MTERLLIRHALPARITESNGLAGADLDPRGRAQAKRLADYLRSEPISTIYASSPLRNCARAGIRGGATDSRPPNGPTTTSRSRCSTNAW
jgi:broad specificity phosphatase PhoE